jgi:hypothetical protein
MTNLDLATLLAALIGAVIGSVGAVIVAYLLARRAEEARTRSALVQRYLYQLQEAAESLWYRLTRREAYDRGGDYWETTMLYTLGRVLAIERIFALEAVYPQLDSAFPKLGEKLRGLRIDTKFDDNFGGKGNSYGCYKYERMLLAELVIEREGEQFRLSTYLEFLRRYEAKGSTEREWLKPVSQAMEKLFFQTTTKAEPQIRKELRESLEKIVDEVTDKTGIDSSIGDPT